ncbi:MAG: hypothetical protein U9O41_02610 [Candidatus Aerophobetes bacterium]|nr:hypothetical protein [Candidatus Aerophobetes bacterium]
MREKKALRVKQIGEHEWGFVYPPEYYELMGKFEGGVELWETGNIRAAAKIYKEVIEEFPGFIDAYHHLGILHEESGKDKLAFKNWLKGYQVGKRAFPRNFIPGKDLLRWGLLENRPFLRCTHALGLCFFDGGNLAKGMELFEFIISANPNDNQGIRAVLVEGYLKMGNYKAVLDICNRYKGDITVELTYGGPYALFKLGDKGKATLLLREAIRVSPKVAKELLKKRHTQPKNLLPDRYTVGGDDEAYYYWQRNEILWEDPEIKEWLKRLASDPDI